MMMPDFVRPRFDSAVLAQQAGKLFGVDPAQITNFHAEQSSDRPASVRLTIEAKMNIPLEEFNAMLNDAQV